jgi:glyceraldehyde-3-phosphate dehydrogenase type II
MNIVHVVGTGTIGEPLIGLLVAHKKEFGIDEVTFHKNQALKRDKTKVKQLVSAGAVLAAQQSKHDDFRALGFEPKYTTEEAIERATVVIDCTPKGVGIQNKKSFYDTYTGKVRGFIAQGSEAGFGKPYAYNINDSALEFGKDQFVQVVSCNTHNIATILNALRHYTFNFQNLLEAKFVCLRRASDISQDEDFVPGIKVDKHKVEYFGTHHARDAARVFSTLGWEPKLYSSSCVFPSQYMHAIHFSLKLVKHSWDPDFNLQALLDCFRQNKMISFTDKMTSNSIFSFGRDYGNYGRILNQTVICTPTLSIRETHDHNAELVGFCFTPQDGNSLVSSLACALWFLHEGDFSKVRQALSCLDKFIFEEI